MQYSALPQQGQPGEGEGGGGWRGVAAQKESFAQKRFADPDEKTTFSPLDGADCYKDERTLNFNLCGLADHAFSNIFCSFSKILLH